MHAIFAHNLFRRSFIGNFEIANNRFFVKSLLRFQHDSHTVFNFPIIKILIFEIIYLKHF